MSLISRKMMKPRPQELGKIKIGGLGDIRTGQNQNQYRLPVKFDHFVVTTRDREKAPKGVQGNFIQDERVHSKIGSSPTELEGHLMFDTPEENFHAEMVQYDGRTKVVSCNGEVRKDPKNGAESVCPRMETDDPHPCKCKPYARLHLQLWVDPIGFYRVFRTTSWESTNNIQSALEDYYERFGSLYHLPVKLIVYPAKVTYEENGQTKTSQSYMVGLVLAKSMQDVAEEMVRARRLQTATQTEMKRLASGVLEEQGERDVEEAEVIAQEFFPNDSVRASVESQSKLDSLKQEMGGVPEDAEEGDYYEVVGNNPHAVSDAFKEGYREGKKKGEAEAGSAPESQTSTDSNEAGAGPPPAEAEPEEEEEETPEKKALRVLAELMEEHAPHLLTDKETRKQWTYRLIQKASPRTATLQEIDRLIRAVKEGDTGAVAADEEPPRTTPFDEDEAEQAEIPV